MRLLKRMMGKMMRVSTNIVRVKPIANFFQKGYYLPSLCFI